MPTFSPPKLHALTALRFFAAAAIVLHHSSGLFPWDQSLTDTFHLSQAVSFFFVLSGFILTYVYPSLDAWPARARFLRARFARIWPAHLAAFALLFLLFEHSARFGTLYGSFPLALLNLSMLQAWVPVRYAYSSFNFVSWTISTEFAFYLLFPLLIHNFHKTWLLKLLLSLALFAASIALVILCHIPPEDPAHSWNISILGIVYVNPLARLFEFTLGMTTALLFQRTLHKPKTRPLTATGLELAAIAGVALNMYLAPAIARLLVGNSPQLAPLRDALVLGQLSCLSFAAPIYIMAHNNGPLARLLSSPSSSSAKSPTPSTSSTSSSSPSSTTTSPSPPIPTPSSSTPSSGSSSSSLLLPRLAHHRTPPSAAGSPNPNAPRIATPTPRPPHSSPPVKTRGACRTRTNLTRPRARKPSCRGRQSRENPRLRRRAPPFVIYPLSFAIYHSRSPLPQPPPSSHPHLTPTGTP